MSKPKPPEIAVPKQLQVRLDDALHAALAEFCKGTNREAVDTTRRVLWLFLADGIDAAEARLTRGVWEKSEKRTRDALARLADMLERVGEFAESQRATG